MTTGYRRALLAATLTAAIWPATAAMAQDATGDWAGMSRAELRSAVRERHDAAVAAMAATVGANDPRYIWAMQAKAQCGIALGFLKSGTRDEDSLGKCAAAAMRMQEVPAPAMMTATAPGPDAQVATVSPELCRQPIVGTVFFDWDSAVVPASAAQTLTGIVGSRSGCGWSALSAVGHTDRSGSDAYNDGLSRQRADAVVAALTQAGLAPGIAAASGRGESEPRVPTADGERNPQNRRVEISAR